ncbi:MAG: hypothetical protein AVDCRST_MAG93-273 [uncultured Chloroflexia bacterium]|uniref:SDR family NAD(P)-dependent oxidoreductase n=1 Tax=uncultured Chloroflexia bacterium TaxID=1672391 RepID=A0A6J4H7B0_9CHLR|nr:MAG: hypothetical protein AVDCRST_MAG93-273 [uncultured Chloroflexia bacterium]
MMGRLNDKVAVVTGASSGIGEATVRALSSEGATVVAGARRKERLDGLVEKVSRKAGRLSPWSATSPTSGRPTPWSVARSKSSDGSISWSTTRA